LIGVTFVACTVTVYATARHRQDEQALKNTIERAFTWVGLAQKEFLREESRRANQDLTLKHPGDRVSWRFKLVFDSMKKQFVPDPAAPWDAPPNRKCAEAKVLIYCLRGGDVYTDTNVFGIAGPDTALETDFLDWEYEAVLAMEVADSKTHWMQPGDYDVQELLAATGRLGDTVKSILPDRIHILFADGEVWALSPDAPIDALKPFLTITAAKIADRDKQLATYRVDQ
jgi:hypothetical protein